MPPFAEAVGPFLLSYHTLVALVGIRQMPYMASFWFRGGVDSFFFGMCVCFLVFGFPFTAEKLNIHPILPMSFVGGFFNSLKAFAM
jgi:hypothetical protein